MEFGSPQMHKNFVGVDVTLDSAEPLPGTDWLTLRFESPTSVVVGTGHLISPLGGFTRRQDSARGIVVIDGIVKGIVRFTVPEGTDQVILADRVNPVASLVIDRDDTVYPCPLRHSLTAMEQMAKAADHYMQANPVIRDLARVVFLAEMLRQAEDERAGVALVLQSKIDFRDQMQHELEAARKKVGRQALAAMDRAGG